ncbi:MAG: hypothetical protein AAFU78_22060, partial [Cyanobacteria bacterium J06633_2]
VGESSIDWRGDRLMWNQQSRVLPNRLRQRIMENRYRQTRRSAEHERRQRETGSVTLIHDGYVNGRNVARLLNGGRVPVAMEGNGSLSVGDVYSGRRSPTSSRIQGNGKMNYSG